MARPAPKTTHAEWWDDDESVTYRTAYSFCDVQLIEEGLVAFNELSAGGTTLTADRAARMGIVIADMILLACVPTRFHVHVVDSVPGTDGIKPWVAFEQSAIATMPVEDLMHIINTIPLGRRGVQSPSAPTAVPSTTPEPTVEESAPVATFPSGDGEQPSLDGAGTPALQAALSG